MDRLQNFEPHVHVHRPHLCFVLPKTKLWPVKVLIIGARKLALQSCSGHLRSKIFTASFFCLALRPLCGPLWGSSFAAAGQTTSGNLFSRAFLIMVSVLLKQMARSMGRETPFLAKISLFRHKIGPAFVFRAF